MRVLIVDDEPLAQTSLATVLRARDDVESFDVVNDGVEALEKLRQETYDVLLMDMNAPSISGMELLDQLRANQRSTPSVIFVTAHQEHAISASQRQAVDYVLKPYSTERLNEALERAAQQNVTQRAMKMFDGLPMLRDKARLGPPRIAIKAKGRILLIDPLQIVSVHAEGNYVLLLTGPTSYLLRESISDLVEKLKPYGFIRIHRSFLVNGSMVEEIHPYATGDYRVRLEGGNEYPVARSYRKNLKSLADFWIGSNGFLTD
jgi:two-component system, LytTR family, response regulator